MQFLGYTEESGQIAAQFLSESSDRVYFDKETLEIRLIVHILLDLPHKEERKALDNWPDMAK